MTDPESITRLRQITAERVEVTPATAAAWVHTLTGQNWRGPADVAAAPTPMPARDKNGRRTGKPLFNGTANKVVSVPLDQFLADLADLGHFVFVASAGSQDIEVKWANAQWDQPYQVKIGEQQTLFPVATDDTAYIDPRFARRLTGRDLRRSLGRITTGKPDAQLIERWVLRRYWGIRPQLTYGTIAAVAKVAALGRIEELDEVVHIGGPANAETATLLVEAWDFLSVGVADLHRAVTRLCQDANRDDVDLDAVDADWSIVRLRVLHEGIATRLGRELSAARAAGKVELWQAAAAELVRRVEQDPDVWLPTVATLNDGQILRLVQHAGIPTGAPDHTVESDVRKWILDAELGSELSTPLLWHGVNLHAAGYGDQFRAALDRRKDGHLDWADELNELRRTTSTAAA